MFTLYYRQEFCQNCFEGTLVIQKSGATSDAPNTLERSAKYHTYCGRKNRIMKGFRGNKGSTLNKSLFQNSASEFAFNIVFLAASIVLYILAQDMHAQGGTSCTERYFTVMTPWGQTAPVAAHRRLQPAVAAAASPEAAALLD